MPEALLERSISFEAFTDIQKAEEPQTGDFIVEAFAATSDLDLQGDVISPEAIRGAAKDLEKNSTVLFNHDPDRPVGKIILSEARPDGLFVRIRVSKTDSAKEVRQLIKEGVINKLSIQGKVLEADKEFDLKSGQIVNVIKRMTLTEGGFVSVPANTEARTLRWYIAKALREADMAKDKKEDSNPDDNKDVVKTETVSVEDLVNAILPKIEERIQATVKAAVEALAPVKSDPNGGASLAEAVGKAVGKALENETVKSNPELLALIQTIKSLAEKMPEISHQPTTKDAEGATTELRTEIDSLKKSNGELASGLKEATETIKNMVQVMAKNNPMAFRKGASGNGSGAGNDDEKAKPFHERFRNAVDRTFGG